MLPILSSQQSLAVKLLDDFVQNRLKTNNITSSLKHATKNGRQGKQTPLAYVTDLANIVRVILHGRRGARAPCIYKVYLVYKEMCRLV